MYVALHHDLTYVLSPAARIAEYHTRVAKTILILSYSSAITRRANREDQRERKGLLVYNYLLIMEQRYEAMLSLIWIKEF